MAINVRKAGNAMQFATAVAYNASRREYVANETTYPHADITSTTSGNYTAPSSSPDICVSATASDLPTVLTRANEIKAVLNRHLVDTYAHKAADTVIATADATDQATANTLLNAIKSKLNTHDASTTYHYTADSTNTVTSSNASDLASSITLANELFTDVNAHIQFGSTTPMIRLIAP